MPYKDPEVQRVWRKRNCEALRAKDKARYWANRDKSLAASKAWYQRNREYAKARVRSYATKNKRKLQEYRRRPSTKALARASRERNRTARLAAMRAWYARNREWVAEYNRKKNQQMTPYLYAIHEMILETARQLPDNAARRQFATEMLYDSQFADVAYRCQEVEEYIVQYTDHLRCTSITAKGD